MFIWHFCLFFSLPKKLKSRPNVLCFLLRHGDDHDDDVSLKLKSHFKLSENDANNANNDVGDEISI